MANLQIAVVVGSLRRESINRKLAIAMQGLAPGDLDFTTVPIGDLPLYNADDEQGPGAATTAFRATIRKADGLLIVSPEYNRSVPGVLKNAIDIGSRPPRENAWRGKPAGIMGVSPGRFSTAMAQQHLRNILACLDVLVMPQPDAYIHAQEGLFTEDGGIGEASREFLQRWMDHYAAWVRSHVG